MEEEIDGANGQILTRKQRKKEYNTNIYQLQIKKRRQWLIKRGKSHILDFHDE